MKNLFLVILSLALCTTLFSFEKKPVQRDQPLTLSTSVIIPCHHSHFEYLFDLLIHFSNQTILPDEIVISLSEANKVDSIALNELNNYPWPFPLQLICTDDKKTAGENRNIACNLAKGGLFICMDADDIPHKKKVEITKYFFENYHINIMLHKYVTNPKRFGSKIDDYQTRCLPHLLTMSEYMGSPSKGYATGYPSLLCSLFEKITWGLEKRTEDVTFLHKLPKGYKQIAFLPADLTLYRPENSTWKNLENRKKNFPN